MSRQGEDYRHFNIRPSVNWPDRFVVEPLYEDPPPDWDFRNGALRADGPNMSFGYEPQNRFSSFEAAARAVDDWYGFPPEPAEDW